MAKSVNAKMLLPEPLKCAGGIAISYLAAIIGGLATAESVGTWYQTLNKPSFNPPDWIFGPVWFILYTFMGIAAYLIVRKSLQAKFVKPALAFFLIQLILNTAWSLLFFGMRSLLVGLIDIAFLWLAILLTTIYFFKISSAAGWLFVPYLLWVTFAAILNYEIFRLN